jgi:hypothetical protein
VCGLDHSFFILLHLGLDLDYSLSHSLFFDLRSFACIIDQIIQCPSENIRQFLSTFTDGTIPPAFVSSDNRAVDFNF